MSGLILTVLSTIAQAQHQLLSPSIKDPKSIRVYFDDHLITWDKAVEFIDRTYFGLAERIRLVDEIRKIENEKGIQRGNPEWAELQTQFEQARSKFHAALFERALIEMIWERIYVSKVPRDDFKRFASTDHLTREAEQSTQAEIYQLTRNTGDVSLDVYLLDVAYRYDRTIKTPAEALKPFNAELLDRTKKKMIADFSNRALGRELELKDALYVSPKQMFGFHRTLKDSLASIEAENASTAQNIDGYLKARENLLEKEPAYAELVDWAKLKIHRIFWQIPTLGQMDFATLAKSTEGVEFLFEADPRENAKAKPSHRTRMGLQKATTLAQSKTSEEINETIALKSQESRTSRLALYELQVAKIAQALQANPSAERLLPEAIEALLTSTRFQLDRILTQRQTLPHSKLTLKQAVETAWKSALAGLSLNNPVASLEIAFMGWNLVEAFDRFEAGLTASVIEDLLTRLPLEASTSLEEWQNKLLSASNGSARVVEVPHGGWIEISRASWSILQGLYEEPNEALVGPALQHRYQVFHNTIEGQFGFEIQIVLDSKADLVLPANTHEAQQRIMSVIREKKIAAHLPSIQKKLLERHGIAIHTSEGEFKPDEVGSFLIRN